MYTTGGDAATPALARLNPEYITLHKEPELLGVLECQWGITEGRPYVRSHTLIEAEEYPGQWQIGAPGGEKYRPAKVKETAD